LLDHELAALHDQKSVGLACGFGDGFLEELPTDLLDAGAIYREAGLSLWPALRRERNADSLLGKRDEG
jgi:hypothetical protein